MAEKHPFDVTALKLTEALVEKLVAAVRAGDVPVGSDGRRWWRDTGSANQLFVVVGPQGAVFYRRWREPGKSLKRKTRLGDAASMRVATARERAHQHAAGNTAAAAAPVRASSAGITCDEAWQAYMAAAAAGHFMMGRKPASANTLRSYDELWKPHVQPGFGSKSLHQLAAKAITLVKGLHEKPVTQARTLQLLKNLFAWASATGHWSKPNPLVNPATGKPAVQLRTVASRARYLTTDEAGRMFAYLQQHEPLRWQVFFKVLLLTGARVSNVRHMRWSEIDTAAGLWNVPTSKTGEPLTLPLVPQVLAALEHQRAATTGEYVFPQGRNPKRPIADVDHVWARVAKGAELEGVRLHDVRRTAGSWGVQAGHPLPSIGALLGHRSSNATAVYSRVSTNESRAVAESVALRLSKALEVTHDGQEEDAAGEAPSGGKPRSHRTAKVGRQTTSRKGKSSGRGTGKPPA